jgi:hypothetical protein
LKLLLKFNLVLVLVFGIGMALISVGAYDFLMKNAQQTVLDQANLMGASASATKNYTEQQISPILEQVAEYTNTFLPQTILRCDHHLPKPAEYLSGVHRARGGAEPHESEGPGDGLGDGPHQLFS